MTAPKTWKVGIADETWKIMVCAQEATELNRLLTGLVYRLTDAGIDIERGLSQIREMSGKQIVDALEEIQRTNYLSVQRGLREAA